MDTKLKVLEVVEDYRVTDVEISKSLWLSATQLNTIVILKTGIVTAKTEIVIVNKRIFLIVNALHTIYDIK